MQSQKVLVRTDSNPSALLSKKGSHLRLVVKNAGPTDRARLEAEVSDLLLALQSRSVKARAQAYRKAARVLLIWAKPWKNNSLTPPVICQKLVEQAKLDLRHKGELSYLACSVIRMGFHYGIYCGGTTKNCLSQLQKALVCFDQQDRVEDLKATLRATF